MDPDPDSPPPPREEPFLDPVGRSISRLYLLLVRGDGIIVQVWPDTVMGAKGAKPIERTRRVPSASAVCSVARSFGVSHGELHHVADCLMTMIEAQIERDSQ